MIHAGIEPEEGKTLLRNALLTPAVPKLEMQVIGVFFKLCSLCHDTELAKKVWDWSQLPRQQTNDKDRLSRITIQYLLLCGRSGKLKLCLDAWNEAVTFGISSHPRVIGAMLYSLALLGAVNETETFISQIPIDMIDSMMLTQS